MTIKINEIKETTATLIDPQSVVVGEIKSHLQLYDVRIQIKNKKYLDIQLNDLLD